MMIRKSLALLLALLLALTCVACGSAESSAPAEEQPAQEASDTQEETAAPEETEAPAEETEEQLDETPAILNLAQQLADGVYQWELSADGSYYALKNVQYCANPTDPEGENLAKQCMNIYVPAAYLTEDGSFDESAEINGFTVADAPIVYKNGVSGYSEALPVDPSKVPEASLGYYWGENQAYLSHGYILVSPGSRGKETVTEDGTFIGKSPAGLVDLKAGIRFLKYNAEVLPGNTDRIISLGTSAGGAMSALVAATGNNAVFDSYLEEIGAVMVEGIGDDVYAAQCFCPLTDLDNADMAYEWCFGGDASNHWAGAYTAPGEGDLNDFQKALSADLSAAYVEYLNGLDLGLTLDSARSGDYYDTLMGYLSDSLNDYLEANYGSVTSDEAAAYVSSTDPESGKVDFTTFAALNEETGRYEITDLDAYVTNYRGRMKMCPAFDNMLLTESENQEFGDAVTNAAHFDPMIYTLLTENDYSALVCEDYNYTYQTFSYATQQMEEISGTVNLGYSEDLVQAYAQACEPEVTERVKLLNVMNYLLADGVNEDNDVAAHVRIRVGSHDADTSFSVALNAALAFEKYAGADVDYGIVWGEGHGSCNDSGNVMAWIDSITR